MISIHALHEESDFLPCLSSPPADISIHALHEESDFFHFSALALYENFNPRSP